MFINHHQSTMTLKASALCTITLLLLFSSPSLSAFPINLSSLFNSESICKFTQHEDFCKNVLPSNKLGNIFDYGRIATHKSLSSAYKFLGSVNYFLKLRSTSSLSAIQALQDCQSLSQLNIDYLSYTLQNINTNNTLNDYQTDELHTLMSAVLTNQQTCLEGVQAATSASNVKNGLLPSIVDGMKLYSISLALFKHGWVQDIVKSVTGLIPLFPDLGDGSLPLIMSGHDKGNYESAGGKMHVPQGGKGVNVSRVVVVNPDSSGDFTTINDAVGAAPNKTGDSNQYFLIYVVSGVYEEYVSIPKNKQNLMMIGAGINKTIITGNHNVADGSTTFHSATFAVVGKGFIGVDITFRNIAGPSKHQAVAVRNSADMSTFYRCSFEGYQDTLYTHSLRQFYRECDIYGTIDFIFGNAAVVFQKCNIYVRKPMDNQFNTITAQGRVDPDQNTGTSIQQCNIRLADDLASSNGTTKTYLGRPWKEYSRTIYMQSFMGELIDPLGWSEWSEDFALDTLYYAEYENKGSGSNTDGRVTWPGYHKYITKGDANNFTVINLIQGDDWLAATGVPFHGGLF